MNMKLRQCFARAKPTATEKKRFCLFFFQKKSSVLKENQKFTIWLQKSQIGDPGSRLAVLD